jgi:hypothetical protein
VSPTRRTQQPARREQLRGGPNGSFDAKLWQGVAHLRDRLRAKAVIAGGETAHRRDAHELALDPATVRCGSKRADAVRARGGRGAPGDEGENLRKLEDTEGVAVHEMAAGAGGAA